MLSACGRHVAVNFFIFPTGWYGLSHMGKNNGIPHLVCQKILAKFKLYIFTLVLFILDTVKPV